MRGLSTLRGPVFYQTLPLLECIFRNPGFWIPAFRTICLPFVRLVNPAQFENLGELVKNTIFVA